MQTRGRIHGGASLIPALLALVITGLTAGAGERFVWSGGSNQSPYENWAKASITITNAIININFFIAKLLFFVGLWTAGARLADAADECIWTHVQLLPVVPFAQRLFFI